MAEHISNTSPLLYLHQAGELDILPRLYREVVVPAEVLKVARKGRKTTEDVL
jgi:predicted nucleic acid-binding protein